MKTPPPASATAASGRFWRVLAAGSVLLNVLLLVWALRPVYQPKPVAAPAATTPVPAVPAARAKASGPYAALGSFVAENNRIPDLGWTEAQFQSFLDGVRASYEGRGLPLDDDARKLRDDINARVQKMLAQEQPDPAEDYFRMLREKEGVKFTPSGLHYRITEVGSGPTAKAEDTVVLSFAAKLPDGRGLPPEFSRARVKMAVKDLLPGLAEGVQLLSVGGKALIYLPAKLSFSAENWPPQIPRNMPVAYFVELHEIVAPTADGE